MADDGPGVPDGAGEVFDYGYTTNADGTGLGLSIVRTMAESHGWTVELETGDDGAAGAQFVFDPTDAAVIPDREVGRRATIRDSAIGTSADRRAYVRYRLYPERWTREIPTARCSSSVRQPGDAT